jgi:nitrogen fixation-related uncharacterized protein
MNGIVLFIIWLGYTGLLLIVCLIFIVWAVRSGQFANQDRICSLPLRIGLPAPARTLSRANDPEESSD